MTGHGGWPLTAFLDPEGVPVLRRHLLPARAPPGDAELSHGAGGGGRVLEHAARADPRLGGADPRAARGDRPHRAVRRAAQPGARRRRGRPAADAGRHAPRRVRRSAQVPARPGARAAARPRRQRRGRGDARRAWPTAASTTRSAAASPATRSTTSGSYPTSRRCSTTTPCWPAPTCTPGRRWGTSAGAASAPTRSTGRCARCAGRKAASTRPSTPTPRERRAASTSGPRTQIRDALAAADLGHLADDAIAYLGVTEAGNFEGRNILHVPGGPAAERPEVLDAALRALRERRAQRVWPSLDDKRLASWNALMIAALADAGAVLGRDDHLDAARRCAEFVLTEMRDERRAPAPLLEGRRGALGRLPGGLRVPGRGAADALRGDLRAALVRRRAPDRRPDDRAVRRSRAGRLLHHRQRPRAADRAPQGRRRPSDSIRQLVGRLRPAAPRRADGGARVRQPGGRSLPPRAHGRRPPSSRPRPSRCARWTSTSPR